MSILLRQARVSDLEDLYKLANQFVLLNLPANKEKLEKVLLLSEKSFKGDLSNEKSAFLFVAEDTKFSRVVGASKIISKHGTKNKPHLSYKVEEKEKFNLELDLSFTHQVLNFTENYDGPTELGGLIVDREYRRRPEKIGKMIGLVRFMFIAANRKCFMENLHCEFAPSLTKEGRSEFWEALGKRFTGLSYEEADRLSHTNKEFIKNLFPEDKIYTVLLDPKARLVVGKVSEETKPARVLMERLGFVYKNEIDPFDGGPHLGVKTSFAKPIQAFESLRLEVKEKLKPQTRAYLIGGKAKGEFRAGVCFPEISESQVSINKDLNRVLEFVSGEEVFIIPLDY